MAREYFNAYHSYLKSIEPLNDAERGRLFTALLEYSSTGVTQELRGSERILFPTMREQIDRDCERYEATCRRNRENGAKGGKRTAANGSVRCQPPPERPPNAPQGKDKDKEEGKGKDKDEGTGVTGGTPAAAPHARTKFIPPTVEEVTAYCRERGCTIDPESFVDFYTANGWKQGQGKPIVDWKAAVRTWARREKPSSRGSNPFLEIAKEEGIV